MIVSRTASSEAPGARCFHWTTRVPSTRMLLVDRDPSGWRFTITKLPFVSPKLSMATDGCTRRKSKKYSSVRAKSSVETMPRRTSARVISAPLRAGPR